MPPVLGPVSPSPARLWSCAAPSNTAFRSIAQGKQADLVAGQALLDNQRAAPASPSAPETIVFLIAACASALGERLQTTPLPPAKPVRLDHDRAHHDVPRSPRAASASVKRSHDAVVMPAASATSLAKALLPSSLAAAAGRAEAADAYPTRAHRPNPRRAVLPGRAPPSRSSARDARKVTSAGTSSAPIATFVPSLRGAGIARCYEKGGEQGGMLPAPMPAHAPDRLVRQ